jgi:arylsulfatase A-like enzyme
MSSTYFRGMRFLLALSALTTALSLFAQMVMADAPRPNVVIFLVDDLGSYDVGYRGSDIKTPHIDALASAGAKLEQFYVQTLCSPTRAALLTGRYPFRYGFQQGVVRPWADYGLPLEERLLPQALKDAGYETALVGKWHLGHLTPDYLPTRRGFDHQYGHYNGAIDYFTHVRDGGFDWHRDDRAARDEGYATHLIAREAVRRVTERDKTKPLFLYVAFNGVHSPHQVPADYEKPYEHRKGAARTYAGMVAAVDEAIGQVTAAVDGQGLAEKTLFLFFADNGGPRPGKLTSNGPLRAGKGTVYEGGTRTCAVAAWRGVIPAGGTVDAPLHVVDLYPTLLALAGATPEQPLPIDGRDAWKALSAGGPSPRDEIVHNIGTRVGAIRVGDWKIVVNGEATDSEDADAPVERQRKRDVALYDLSTDVAERNNLAAARPDVVARLLARYDQLAKTAVPSKVKPKPGQFTAPPVWGEAAAGAK